MKPKCPKCGKSVWLRGFFNQRHGSMLAICGNGRSCWSRCVSRAAIIRLAVEPKKPETCKWKKSPKLGAYSIKCGLLGRYGKWVPSYCEGCGKPVEVEG